MNKDVTKDLKYEMIDKLIEFRKNIADMSLYIFKNSQEYKETDEFKNDYKKAMIYLGQLQSIASQLRLAVEFIDKMNDDYRINLAIDIENDDKRRNNYE